MKKLVIANWKMNGSRAMARDLAAACVRVIADLTAPPDVVLCPPFPYLSDVCATLEGTSVHLGAQDVAVAEDPKGAQTGDVSPAMLADLGCRYVMMGHSERRARHGETDRLISAKMRGAQMAGLIPILCVGENAAVRAQGAGAAMAIVRDQVTAALQDLSTENMVGVREWVIAYEPIWAIGSGAAAKESDIIEMHDQIGRVCQERLAPGVKLRRMYGGSVNGGNAAAVLALPGVDGVLVGGASLKAEAFTEIIRAAAVAQK